MLDINADLEFIFNPNTKPTETINHLNQFDKLMAQTNSNHDLNQSVKTMIDRCVEQNIPISIKKGKVETQSFHTTVTIGFEDTMVQYIIRHTFKTTPSFGRTVKTMIIKNK